MVVGYVSSVGCIDWKLNLDQIKLKTVMVASILLFIESPTNSLALFLMSVRYDTLGFHMEFTLTWLFSETAQKLVIKAQDTYHRASW